jgi:hypothetical protein
MAAGDGLDGGASGFSIVSVDMILLIIWLGEKGSD